MYSYSPDKPGNTRDMRRGHSRFVLNNPLTPSRLPHRDLKCNQHIFTVVIRETIPTQRTWRVHDPTEPVKLGNVQGRVLTYRKLLSVIKGLNVVPRGRYGLRLLLGHGPGQSGNKKERVLNCGTNRGNYCRAAEMAFTRSVVRFTRVPYFKFSNAVVVRYFFHFVSAQILLRYTYSILTAPTFPRHNFRRSWIQNKLR